MMRRINCIAFIVNLNVRVSLTGTTLIVFSSNASTMIFIAG
jgi:hypothetical protein